MKKRVLVVLLLVLTMFAFTTALAADKFVFEEPTMTIFEGDAVQPALIRDGKFAEDGMLTYKVTSGGKFLSVAEDGTMTGLLKGEANVVCTLTLDNGTVKKASATVKVARRVTSVELNTKKLNVYEPDDGSILELLEQDTPYRILVLPIGKAVELSATVLPEDASNRKALFETTDRAVALIQNNTGLKGTKVGECDLRVYSKQNPEVEDWYHVLVVQPVTKITVTGDSRIVMAGSQIQLTADCQPSNASMKEVIWSSENPNVATVDEYGTVTGLKKGTATVKATAADGSAKFGTFQVSVQQGPESITVKNSYEVVDVNSNKTLRGTVQPSTANNQNVVWSSSDTSIATVTKGGNVKGVSVGQCVLTCASEADPSVYATVTVEVQQPVTKITFDQSSVSVDAGASVNVSWSVLPATATNPTVTLKSANERIATVDQYGRITGVKKGTTTIIATSADGSNRTARLNVKVTQPVEGVYFRQDLYHVPYGDYLSLHSWTTPKDADNQHMTWYTDDAYIATVNKGYTTNNSNSVYGRRIGATTLYCVTEDGGYTASAVVNVDYYNDPLEIRDLYLNANRIKMNVYNQSQMNLTRFFFSIEVYDVNGFPLPVTSNGDYIMTGYYLDELAPGDTTVHGRFYFDDYVQPVDTIGGLIVKITGYRTDETYVNDGKVVNFTKNLSEDHQIEVRYPTNFVPTPVLHTGDLDTGVSPESEAVLPPDVTQE